MTDETLASMLLPYLELEVAHPALRELIARDRGAPVTQLLTLASIAISLKRIADALTVGTISPTDQQPSSGE